MKNHWMLFAPLLLGACSGSPEKVNRVCPQVAAVRELSSIADFGREEITNVNTLVAAGRIGAIEGKCKYDGDTILVDADVQMLAQRGKKLGSERVEFSYFAAVLGAGDTPVSKQNLTVQFRFDGNGLAETVEKLRIAIPAGENADGNQWRVLLGFQLSPEQLAYNRSQMATPTPWASPAGSVTTSGAQ